MSYIKTQLFVKIGAAEVMRVIISINDKCNNGYENIHINSEKFKSFKVNPHKEETINFEGRKYVLDCIGLDRELILKHFPKLECILKLNGCDLFGFHSYPIQDTIYFCKHNPRYAMQKYRLTKEEVELIPDLNETAVAKLMYKISKVRYSKEISEAIAVIEEISGEKFKRLEHISHALENDIVFCIKSEVPKKERCWNLLKGQELPKKYSLDF